MEIAPNQQEVTMDPVKLAYVRRAAVERHNETPSDETIERAYAIVFAQTPIIDMREVADIAVALSNDPTCR